MVPHRTGATTGMGQVTTSVMEASAVAEAIFPTLPAWHRPRQLSRVLTRIFSWRGRVPQGEPGQEVRPPFPLDYNVDGGAYEKKKKGSDWGGKHVECWWGRKES